MAKMSNQVTLPSEQRKPERAEASKRKGQQKGRGGPENAAFRFKGVRQRTWGKWVAELRIPRGGPVLWLGSFDNAVDAAVSYDKAARTFCGPNPKLNFPEVQPPENPPASSPIKSQARVDTELQLCPPGASSSSSNTNRSHPGANASKLIPPGTGASSSSSSSNVLCPPGMTTYPPY